MKLHRSLAEAIVQSLYYIFSENKYADKVIEKTLKQNPKWGARDRRFIAETVYDIVRWKRLYKTISQSSESDYWKWLAVWLVQHNYELPVWKELNVDVPFIAKQLKENLSRAIEQSIPDWLDELGQEQLGDKWNEELAALNEQAKVVLRVNILKTTKNDLAQKLMQDEIGVDTISGFPDALVLEKRQNIFQSQYFKEGLFEVMDAGSQMIAGFLLSGKKVDSKGLRVIDACAGAGGKTLHLAALLNNKGKIIAMDTEQWKLEELSKRARRAGAFNIEPRVIESGKTIKRLENSADYLLLDVPCSGLGVLRRNPDAKWKLSLDFIERVNTLQQEIIQDYCLMLKIGGTMVYSTCSILPKENQEIVQSFLSKNPHFTLEDEKHCWPSEGFDGFYMARILKR